MANDQWIKIIVGGAIILYLFGGLGGTTQQGTGDTSGGGTIVIEPIGCNYAPTVSLGAQDKYDSSVDVDSGTWKYKLNGGVTSTDADGSFEVRKDSKLEVLVADANSSTHYRAIWTPQLECGVNPRSYNDVVKFSTYETKCYSENGKPLNGTTYAVSEKGDNVTIGTGGSRTVHCELTTAADTGMPYGGVMVLEFNQSTYDEGKMDLQWDGSLASTASTPNAYTVATAGHTTKSFNIPAFEDTGTKDFYITLQAESTVNPTNDGTCTGVTVVNDVLGRIYPKNCFEEEDVTPSVFKCEINDMDNTFTSPGGTSKTTGQITTFLICVD